MSREVFHFDCHGQIV